MLEGILEYIRGFVKKIDNFGVSFSFKYKSEEKYTTFTGGMICLIFYICSIIYFTSNLVPFFRKENFTLQFFTMNLQKTEEIKLKESKTAFAFGLTCPKENTTKIIRELFDLKLNFMRQIKDGGHKITNITNVTTHNCRSNDFYNLHNDSFELLNIQDLQFIDQKEFNDHQLEGIYTDQIFTYYRFIVSSKNKNEAYFKTIDNFLLQNDCKLQFYYTDITANLSNYKEPIQSYINSLFLQLNPALIQEKNVFFMNYNLFNESKFLHIFDDDKNPRIVAGFSRVEDYFLYKGLNRTLKESYESENYAKLYIRVDNKKIVIKRKYQDFMEFYADNSSLLITILDILCIIFSFYDQLRANHSISKKLFFYEGIEHNQFEELKKIRDTLNSTKEKDMRIYNSKKENVKMGYENRDIQNSQAHSKRKILNNNYIQEETESDFTSVNDEKKEKKLIKYTSYSMYEMIIETLPSFCKKKKFKYKESLIRQSHSILDSKLDIFLYIRNMLLFDSINQLYLENKSIINFLSRPIIYLNKDEEKENKKEKEREEEEIKEIKEDKKEEEIVEKEFYKYSYKLDSEDLFKRIQKLAKKPDKTDIEKKIIYFLKKKLKGV